MTGVEPIKVGKHVGWSSANCLVRNNEVALGMTQNSWPYMCSNSCTPMFETAAILEDVIAACLAFLLAVLEYNAITMNVVLINDQ